jgi:hypothetical protein
MENLEIDNSQRKMVTSDAEIEGWGIDADPKNEPTYPMKHYTGADHDRLNYERPVQQEQHEEILMSIERPSITRVFGTSTPPTGRQRHAAPVCVKFSEASSGHWMTLILADRVNAVEGIVTT